MQDPDCYDRRSEKKKIKNGTKLKLRREFPVSTSKVLCAIISSMLSTTTPPPPTTPTTPTTLLYSYTNTPPPTTTTILYCPPTTALYICSNDLYYISCSAPNNPMA